MQEGLCGLVGRLDTVVVIAVFCDLRGRGPVPVDGLDDGLLRLGQGNDFFGLWEQEGGLEKKSRRGMLT